MNETIEEVEDEKEEHNDARPRVVRKRRNQVPVHPQRSAEDLRQYERLFRTDLTNKDDDQLADTLDAIPAGWSRQQIYEHFAARTHSVYRMRIIPYPDWINAQGSSDDEPLYVKNRNVCR